MAEKASATAQPARPVLEGSVAAETARTAWPASVGGAVLLGTGSAASPQPAVGAMGRCAPRVLLRPPGKSSAIRERRRPGSGRRDGCPINGNNNNGKSSSKRVHV